MPAASVRFRDVLTHPVLRALLLADVLDGSGTWAFGTVFSFVVFERTGSVTWISVALASRWVPALIVGPFAGVLADRYDRARVMIVSALAGGVLMGVLAVAVAARAPLALLLVVSAVQAVTAAAYNPAFAAALPDLVPEHLLAAANSLREVVNNVTVILGPALATLFLIGGEPSLGVAFNALTFLVPVVVLLRLRLRSRPEGGGERSSVLAELRDGAAALRAQRTAMLLVVAMAMDSAVAGLTTAFALPLSVYVGTGPDHYTYLLVATALGSVLAAAVAGRLAARPRLATVIVAALVVQSLPFALVVAAPHAVPAFVLILLSGAGMIVVDILTITVLQRDVPGAYLGRIFGILDTVLYAAIVVFTLLGGALVSAAGMRTALLVVGLGVAALELALWPALHATDRQSAARAAVLEPVVELLGALDLFDGADRPTLERLAAAAVPETREAGAVLLREGNPATELYLLARGTLAVRTAAAGDLPPVEAPGYVGEIGLLHARPRTATVAAATECALYRLSGADFLDALNGRPASASLLLLSGRRLARTEPSTTARPRPRPRPTAA